MATKLFKASLVTANTVIEFPDANSCAGTTVPEPFAAVSTLTFVAIPGVTVMIPDGVVANAPAVALISPVPIKCAVNNALLLSTAAIRSPDTTPPVMFSKIQDVAATLATKLSDASLVIANTVIEAPETSD